MLTRVRWKKRAVRFDDETSAVRRLVSACGEYRVDRRQSRYGLSTRFYALRRTEAPWGCAGRSLAGTAAWGRRSGRANAMRGEPPEYPKFIPTGRCAMKRSFFDWREAGQWAREECDRTGAAMLCYSWRGEWLVFPAAHPLPPEQWRFEFSVHPAGELTNWEAVDAIVRPEGICRGCGGAKEYGCLVCWVCFKGERSDGVAPFKYFRPACDLNAWLVATGRPPVTIDPALVAASPWRRFVA